MESMPFDQHTSTAALPSLSGDSQLPSQPRDSAALRRLMEEVRNEDMNGSSAAAAYDRAHNRHNR